MVVWATAAEGLGETEMGWMEVLTGEPAAGVSEMMPCRSRTRARCCLGRYGDGQRSEREL
jgi:hypothetical protein